METALTYDVEELMGGLDFARMAGEIATRHGKILRVHLAACRTFPLAGRIAHRSWNLTV